MSQTLLQMFGSGTGGTENSVATIDVPEDGVIEGITVNHAADMDADGESSFGEISFIATNQLSTNDVRGVLAVSRMQAALVTSGMIVSANNFHIPMNVEVSGGERLHMHISASAGVNTTLSAMIHFAGRGRTIRRSRRSTR